MTLTEQHQRDLTNIKALLEYDSGLTEWEVEFVESVNIRLNQSKMKMTERQRDKIDQILRRLEK